MLSLIFPESALPLGLEFRNLLGSFELSLLPLGFFLLPSLRDDPLGLSLCFEKLADAKFAFY